MWPILFEMLQSYFGFLWSAMLPQYIMVPFSVEVLIYSGNVVIAFNLSGWRMST